MTEGPVALPPKEARRPGIGLCLSGGGYRAMLFHLGALWRLNEIGYLPGLVRISSVSGGSMTNGALALAWKRLEFDEATGVASNFNEEVVAPLRRLAGKTIDLWAIVLGILLPGPIGNWYARGLRRNLLGDATLKDVPGEGVPGDPRFVFNAANLQSAVLWRFSHPYMRDYRVGMIEKPVVDLGTAVAASGAFPPFLAPVKLTPKPSDWTPGSGHDLQRAPYTETVYLADGGVYDNLGLETVDTFETVLISDGGGHIAGVPKVKWDWFRQMVRVVGVIDSQVRAQRKRSALEHFQNDSKGTYWGIWTDIADYGVETLPCPYDKTEKLAHTPTRLKAMDAALQERLINWGYAVCDAATRRWVDQSIPAASDFPYPAAGVG